MVWDTARRDHLSLYGHPVRTTPFLEEWARDARVYTNCISAGSTTVPAHVSIFTGMLAAQHGAGNARPRIPLSYETLAERLLRSGYQTYLYAANPHILARRNITQGFEVVEHPWDEQYVERARRLIREKIDARDHSTELAQKINGARGDEAPVTKSGSLARDGLRAWLQARDPSRPFFAFLNYMEAHRPFIPHRSYRERLMTAAEIEAAYELDRSWPTMWSYTLGRPEYTDDQLALLNKLYDATLLELDDLFRGLIELLEELGLQENTIVVLTSDHGEHLGEHHMLDHQYSVYNELMYVPLVVRFPAAIRPGRDPRPVMNFDLFPTLLDLAGTAPPAALDTRALDLRRVPDRRARLGEYPQWVGVGIRKAQERHPAIEAAPWQRSLQAFYRDQWKLILASDGGHELYDLSSDPQETDNLIAKRPQVAQSMERELRTLIDGLRMPDRTDSGPDERLSPAELRRLAALGYAGSPEPDEEGSPATRPPAGPD